MFNPITHSQQVSHPIGNCIDVVTEDLVRTPEGRLRYFEFLVNNPKIDPIYKLFGTNSPQKTEEISVEQFAKKILTQIHPDLSRNIDKDLCTELFKLVMAAKDEYMSSQKTFSTFAFVGQKDPFVLCVQKQQWREAKELLPPFDRDALIDNPRLACLCTIVLIRLNDLDNAAKYSSVSSEKTADILKRCSDNLANLDYSAIEKTKQKLLDSFNEINGLQTIWKKELEDIFSYHGVPNFFVPYRLCVALKNCCRSLDDILGYEIFLRQAIRACPKAFIDEKKLLIEELKTWIKDHYSSLTDIRFLMRKFIIDICTSFIANLQRVSLSDSDFEAVKCKIDLFIQNQKSQYLDDSIQFMQNIIGKRNYMYSSFVPSFIKNYTGNFCERYSETTIKQLEKLLFSLSGLKNYIINDKQRAASDFLTAKEYIPLGVLYLEFSRYEEAIDSWKKAIKVENYSSNTYNQLLKCILIAMNQHDTTYIDAQLGKIDDQQKLALETILYR